LLGIRTAPVRVAAVETAISVLGQVTPAPDSRLPVPAPYEGTVKSLLRLEGAQVRKGEPLAAIASVDMRAAEAREKGFAARYRSARAAADRAKALVADGIAPASRAEQANAEAAAAAADLAASRRVMAQVSGSESGDYRLLAPADGRIAAIEVAVGQRVAAMQPMIELDTRRELWVEGALPASAIGKVSPGDGVVIEGLSRVHGEVVAAGASIDPRTRSATVRARLTAPGALVSGQTVRMAIQRKADGDSFAVPRVAVIEMPSGPAVFVARRGGFAPVAVRVLARGPRDATVAGLLGPRDMVAVSGITELKAASAQD
jgi:cobalt-zinc-cadmium efflux system membrane fusion protein